MIMSRWKQNDFLLEHEQLNSREVYPVNLADVGEKPPTFR
jgi:hypothetical protein